MTTTLEQSNGLVRLAGLIERMAGLGWGPDSQDLMRACWRLAQQPEHSHIDCDYVLEMAEAITLVEHGDDHDPEPTRRFPYFAEACQYYNGNILAALCAGNIRRRDGTWRPAAAEGRDRQIVERAGRIAAHHARQRQEREQQQEREGYQARRRAERERDRAAWARDARP